MALKCSMSYRAHGLIDRLPIHPLKVHVFLRHEHRHVLLVLAEPVAHNMDQLANTRSDVLSDLGSVDVPSRVGLNVFL